MPDSATRAIRTAYDAVAADYARLLPDVTLEAPLDRAVLATFAEMVGQPGSGAVAEVGCGTGRVTAHLAGAGLRMVGLDLSPGMLAQARSAHPALAFAAADARALPMGAETLDGLVAWYSIIHLRPESLPSAFAEFARVTRPRAPVLVAFQSGDGERVDRTTSYGQPVPLTSYRHSIDVVTHALTSAGLALHATVRRELSLVHETTPQAFLLAQRASSPLHA